MATQKLKAKAQERLKSMLEKEGRLTASMVLAEAKKKNSPLHTEFEWDDSLAAHQYRLWQARRLIKRYNIVVQKPEERLVHVPSFSVKGSKENDREGEYKTLGVVVESVPEFERAHSEALKRLASARRAVEELEAVGSGKGDDVVAALTLALKSLSVAEQAVQRLH